MAFGLQIYGDFSGYSRMAQGVSHAFGVDLMENFDRPYTARSFREFWRRWHISLSTWFRDYVYVPLGGSRQGPAREGANILATMLLSGLWHGAGWTFPLWGAMHGALMLLERATALLATRAGGPCAPARAGWPCSWPGFHSAPPTSAPWSSATARWGTGAGRRLRSGFLFGAAVVVIADLSASRYGAASAARLRLARLGLAGSSCAVAHVWHRGRPPGHLFWGAAEQAFIYFRF